MSNIVRKSASCIILGCIAVCWFGIVIWRTGFDGLYGQDAFGYYSYAHVLLTSLQTHTLPPPYYWPIGYPALIAIGWLLGIPNQLAAQLPALMGGTLVVLFTALLTYEVMMIAKQSTAATYLACTTTGICCLVAGQLMQWSISAMADTMALAWAVLAAWASLRCVCRTAACNTPKNQTANDSFVAAHFKQRRGHPPVHTKARVSMIAYAILVGFALGMAISTRWMYIILVPIIAISMNGLLSPLQFQRFNVSTFQHFSVFLLALGLTLSPQLAISMANPGQLTEHPWLVRWAPVHALQSHFVTPDGNAAYDLPNALFYLRAIISPRTLAPPFWLLLPFGSWAIWRWRNWPVTWILGGWLMVVLLVLVGIPYQNMRFALALLPPLAILVGIGMAWCWQHVPQSRIGLAVILILGTCSGLWYSLRIADEIANRKQADLASVAWVEQQLPPNSRLLAFELTLTLQHYSTLDVQEIYGMQPADLASEIQEHQRLFLLIDTNDIAGQWAGTPLTASYRWLRDTEGLTEIGRMRQYTLFEVGS